MANLGINFLLLWNPMFEPDSTLIIWRSYLFVLRFGRFNLYMKFKYFNKSIEYVK